ncbi:hypothetical protein [Mucilaginibacter jinjuensis]|uniref:LTXXQ motif family protein n=1 Tax=Mucilaginibacter jinjuensis TaxID=1176721 RepID=A0ABY7TEH9_9SPHI|nr:hypothetical protein [Mucilaginibacter jinjuensis]WCT14940.1 hypothetical protein PQO05_13435 [Mucilaginibacter jinjuensis]
MKRIILTLVLAGFTFGAFAQVSKEDVAITQAYFKKDKKALVHDVLKLSDAQGHAFWPVYEAYEAKRVAISNKRIAIINDYLKGYHTLTGQEATALTGRLFANDKALLDLQKSFFNKFVTAVGGLNAAKFYQLEYYVQSVVRMRVQDTIPYIGETDAHQ